MKTAIVTVQGFGPIEVDYKESEAAQLSNDVFTKGVSRSDEGFLYIYPAWRVAEVRLERDG